MIKKPRGPRAAPVSARGNRMSFETYWRLSRSHTHSLLLALPLLLLYEVAVIAMNRSPEQGVRNLADIVLRQILGGLGLPGSSMLVGLMILAALGMIIHEQRREPVAVDARILLLMLVESLLLALLFYLVVASLTRAVLLPFAAQAPTAALPLSLMAQAELGLGQQLILSLGAGLYEELLFRVILVSAIAWPLSRSKLLDPAQAGLLAVLLSALIFSCSHYLGVYGDAWSLGSFMFRFIAGLVFSSIFLLRGFGIVAWTHAFYDLGFLLLLAR